MTAIDMTTLLIYVSNDSDVPPRKDLRYDTPNPAKLVEAIDEVAQQRGWDVERIGDVVNVYGHEEIKTMRGLIAQVAGRAKPGIMVSTLMERLHRGEDHADACRGWQDSQKLGADV